MAIGAAIGIAALIGAAIGAIGEGIRSNWDINEMGGGAMKGASFGIAGGALGSVVGGGVSTATSTTMSTGGQIVAAPAGVAGGGLGTGGLAAGGAGVGGAGGSASTLTSSTIPTEVAFDTGMFDTAGQAFSGIEGLEFGGETLLGGGELGNQSLDFGSLLSEGYDAQEIGGSIRQFGDRFGPQEDLQLGPSPLTRAGLRGQGGTQEAAYQDRLKRLMFGSPQRKQQPQFTYGGL